MENIQQLKLDGNDCFRNGNYLESSVLYSRAIQELEVDKNSIADVLILRATLYSNRAACWLKLERYENCVDDCTYAISLVHDDKKTFYRRALAYRKLGLINKSTEDIKMLLYLDPQNPEGRKLLQEIKKSVESGKKGTQIGTIMEYLMTDKVKWESLIPQLISLIDDDISNALELGNHGHLNRVFAELLQSLLSSDDVEKSLCINCLKLLSVLCKHVAFVEKFAQFSYYTDSLDCLDHMFSIDGKLNLEVLKLMCSEHSSISMWGTIVSKNLLASFANVKKLGYVDSQVFVFISKILCGALRMQNVQNYGTLCDVTMFFAANELEFANDRELPSPSDKNLVASSQKSRKIIQDLFQAGILSVLFTNLESFEPPIRNQSMSLAGKLIKHFGNDEEIQKILTNVFFLSSEHSWDVTTHRKIALIEAALFASNPLLGCWMLEKAGGLCHLRVLLGSSDERNVEIATEVVCLAAGNDSSAASLSQLVEDCTIYKLTKSESSGIAAAAGSALAKLSIRSKSLTKESIENVEILNCAVNVIRKHCCIDQTLDRGKSPFNEEISSYSVVMNSVERAVEIIAAMSVNSYTKEEIVHGSYRCKECITELLKIDIGKGSSLAFGISQIISSLTVTNRELKLLLLAERDISVEQYEKLQELQRIKTKDENGNIIEEKQTEEDLDSQDLCNKRIQKIVDLGGIEVLLRILKGESNQAKYLSARTLRQICVEYTVRGKFIGCGGLKLCIKAASDLNEELRTRMEASHAVAKVLVTTNPNMLADHLRTGSIQPLLLLCRESKCSQLQQFESLLALTNLLSCGDNERDKFVEINGIPTIHYLMFSDNIMVRRASTEALCNLSGHESLLKVLRNEENLKLWLGLAEDWDGDEESSERFKTARAAIATVAIAAQDADVSKALFQLNCVETMLIILRTKNDELIQRVIFLIQQLMNSDESLEYLKNQNLIDALKNLNDNQDFSTVAEEIEKSLS